MIREAAQFPSHMPTEPCGHEGHGHEGHEPFGMTKLVYGGGPSILADADQLSPIYLDGTLHQLRNVERAERQVVVVGRGLGKQEGFARLPIGREIGDIGSGIKSVFPTAAEDEPTAVAAPRVVALHVRTIHGLHRLVMARAQIQQIEIGIPVPDGEVAIGRRSEHQLFAIGRDAGETGTQSLLLRMEKRIDLRAKGALLRIEGDTKQVLAYLPVLLRHRHTVGGTEIELLAIGREAGEGLPMRRSREQR